MLELHQKLVENYTKIMLFEPRSHVLSRHLVKKIGRPYFIKKLNLSFFQINPEILAKLSNLIYYLILTSTLTLTPDLIGLAPTLNISLKSNVCG